MRTENKRDSSRRQRSIIKQSMTTPHRPVWQSVTHLMCH